jgi:hypothetical protein
MWISKKILTAILVSGCGFIVPISADDLTFTDGSSQLTGTVRTIDEQDRVEFLSPLSPEPLLLKGGTIEKVEFSMSNSAPATPSALIELTNGDLLPATIESLDDRILIAKSPAAGRLDIPRNSLSSLQLGIRQRNLVYAGPRGLEEWMDGEADAKNWTFTNNSLVVTGPATASMKLPTLPKQFILRFTLKWKDRQSPNFQVYFADPLKAKGKPSDRYYLQFGTAGLEIKREASMGKRYNTIVQLNRTPTQFPERQVRVEIRTDRNTSRLQLFLNDEPEGAFDDPFSPVPDGSGITLVSNAPSGSTQEILNIEVLDYDDSRIRHHAEERGDPKTDSLISSEDDRWSGHLTKITKTSEGSIFHFFNSDVQKDPLEIPETDVSTVFFSSVNRMNMEGEAPRLILKTRGDGSLRVKSCRFKDDVAYVDHPLLGKLELSRHDIISIVRSRPAKPKPTPES